METLQQMVLIYGGVLILNLALSALLWRRYRTPLHRDLFIYWTTSVVFFLSQGIPVQGTYLLAVWGLPAFFTSYTLAQLISRLSGLPIPRRLYIALAVAAPFLSAVIHKLGAPFWAVALPPSVAVALPAIATPLRALFQKDAPFTLVGKALLLSVLALGLHDLDYAFLRDKPQFGLLGFTIALLIVFAISITAPGTVLERVTEERTRMQEQNEFQRRFFANVTHELRTPLTIILSPIESILAGEFGLVSPKQRTYLEATWRNGVRLLKLINDLLELAKLEEGFLALHKQPSNLQSLLEELVSDARPLAARKQLQLSLSTEGPPPTLALDSEKMERVFVNLLANAIKFTERGEVAVHITSTPTSVEVAIQDTGIGIAADRLSHVFERFHQADASVSRRFGGTGIGLAYAKEIVELHGGKVTVESTPGKGSRFVVHLDPRAKASPVPDGNKGNRKSGKAGAITEDVSTPDWTQQLQRQRVYRFAEIRETPHAAAAPDLGISSGGRLLLVEDNVEVLQLLSVHLRERHSLTTATDGHQGLEAARRERPDLIVTDFMMPVMDGLTMLKALRADDQLRDIPVIMLSARNELEDRLSGREAGADVYLGKPFSPRELEAAIHHLLEKRGRHVQSMMRAHVEGLEIVSAGLAHEIQNPLNFVKNAQLLIAENLEKLTAALEGMPTSDEARVATVKKAQQKIGRMVESASRGVKRIEDVVALMRRYAREGYPTEASEVELDSAVRDVVELVVPRGEVDCQTTLDLAAPGRLLQAVPEDLNQVIKSLVQNAVEAAGSGGKISIKTRASDENVILEVTDNGPGIAPEDVPKIFSPFYSTKSGSGRGLGLAIVQTVVNRAAGSIEVNTMPKAGATFRIKLPALPAASALSDGAVRLASGGGPAIPA
jgi:signal transduction histidine kinase